MRKEERKAERVLSLSKYKERKKKEKKPKKEAKKENFHHFY
jgi:hypothetical protein